MKPKSSVFGKLITGLAVVTISASVAQAAVLFSDDFNRDGSLSGSTPTVVNATYYPGGLTWQNAADTATTTTSSGGLAQITGAGGGYNAFLAFTPESGKQYLMTVVADQITDNMVIGLGNQIDSTFANPVDWWDADIKPSVLVRIGANNDWGTNTAAGWTLNGFSYTDVGYNTVSWLLDTNPATWTATLSVNGTEIGTVNVPDNDVTAVGFGRAGNSPTFNVDSISLQIIPEPTSGLMLIAGAAGLCLHRRRIRG